MVKSRTRAMSFAPARGILCNGPDEEDFGSGSRHPDRNSGMRAGPEKTMAQTRDISAKTLAATATCSAVSSPFSMVSRPTHSSSSHFSMPSVLSRNLVVPKTIDSSAAGPLAQALIVDLALMSLFAIQHSVMRGSSRSLSDGGRSSCRPRSNAPLTSCNGDAGARSPDLAVAANHDGRLAGWRSGTWQWP